MRFLVTYAWAADATARREGTERFLQTGGRPPAGVELLGRWTRADLSGGTALVQSTDAKALAEFAQQWGDLMEIDVVPVLEDAEVAEVFQRRR